VSRPAGSSRRPRPRATPLSRLLSGRATRATALDVFQLARRKWLAGERLDIGRLAAELGVSRATVFRWVGSREQLYGEVISSLFAAELERAQVSAGGTGADHVCQVIHTLLAALLAAEPLRRFVRQDPEFALQVLMSRRSPVEHRCTSLVRGFLDAQIAAGHIRPPMASGAMAYVIVRISESFLYRDVITGDEPDIDTASEAIRILVTSESRRRRK
jgi:AcrR family transcriptional regulator